MAMDSKIEERNSKYQIMGIHEGQGVPKVVRVRFFFKDEFIDEDIPLPEVRSLEDLLEEAITARLKELKKGKNE